MASFISVFDIQATIYRHVGDGPAIGIKSKWNDVAFPNTGQDIDGFFFDERRWNDVLDDNEAHFVPVLWDPSMVGIADNVLTGIGDNNDLLLLDVVANERNDTTVWNPRLLHGYYYSEDSEFYIHSDDGVITSVTLSGIIPGGTGNVAQLDFTPKTGTPLIARSYRWEPDDGVYLPDRTVRKTVAFTGQFTASGELVAQIDNTVFWQNVNTSEEEWFLDSSTNPPRAVFNQQVVKKVGDFHPSTSGLSQAQLDQLDDLGISTALPSQQFHLKHSPIDKEQEVRIYSDFQGIDNRIYTLVSGFTPLAIDECKVDRDLGIVEFGTTAAGGVPSYGARIRAAYHKTIGIEYEPKSTRDYVESVSADMNPIRRFSGDGFLFLRNKVLDVTRLDLTALLPEISSNFFGPLLLGNSFSTIQATAYSVDDEVIEGQQITFEIVSSEVGGFGAAPTATAVTNGKGQARTLYNPPRTIDKLGGITDQVNITASGSQLLLSDYLSASANDTIFLFQIAREDLILGIPKAQLRTYYEGFLIDEGANGPSIDFNLDLTGNFAWLGSAVEDQIKWEVWHRQVHNLSTPTVYEDGDLRTGKKSVISQIDSLAVNPHTGTTPAVVPVQPIGTTVTSSGTLVNFDVALPIVTSGSPQKSYLVVGPTKVRLRARTLNERTNTVVLSNTIEILIDIPDAAKGLLNIDLINSVPSGLLGNAHYFNQVGTDLEPVELLASGLLPIGWRLRSPTVTLASALDGVTFLDLNPIPQSYEHDELTSSGELLINLSHNIEVII